MSAAETKAENEPSSNEDEEAKAVAIAVAHAMSNEEDNDEPDENKGAIDLAVFDLRKQTDEGMVKDIVRGYILDEPGCVVMFPPNETNLANWVKQWHVNKCIRSKEKCEWFLIDTEHILTKQEQRHCKTKNTVVLFTPQSIFDYETSKEFYSGSKQAPNDKVSDPSKYEEQIYVDIAKYYENKGISNVITVGDDTISDTLKSKGLVVHSYTGLPDEKKDSGVDFAYYEVGNNEPKYGNIFDTDSIEYKLEQKWDGNKKSSDGVTDEHNDKVSWWSLYLFTIKCLNEYIHDTGADTRYGRWINTTKNARRRIERRWKEHYPEEKFKADEETLKEEMNRVIEYVDNSGQQKIEGMSKSEQELQSGWWGRRVFGNLSRNDILNELFSKLNSKNGGEKLPETVVILDMKMNKEKVFDSIQKPWIGKYNKIDDNKYKHETSDFLITKSGNNWIIKKDTVQHGGGNEPIDIQKNPFVKVGDGSVGYITALTEGKYTIKVLDMTKITSTKEAVEILLAAYLVKEKDNILSKISIFENDIDSTTSMAQTTLKNELKKFLLIDENMTKLVAYISNIETMNKDMLNIQEQLDKLNENDYSHLPIYSNENKRIQKFNYLIKDYNKRMEEEQKQIAPIIANLKETLSKNENNDKFFKPELSNVSRDELTPITFFNQSNIDFTSDSWVDQRNEIFYDAAVKDWKGDDFISFKSTSLISFVWSGVGKNIYNVNKGRDLFDIKQAILDKDKDEKNEIWEEEPSGLISVTPFEAIFRRIQIISETHGSYWRQASQKTLKNVVVERIPSILKPSDMEVQIKTFDESYQGHDKTRKELDKKLGEIRSKFYRV